MSNFHISIQGTSGTGKGTRTMQLIQYLMTKYSYNRIIVDCQSEGTKEVNVGEPGKANIILGLYFPDINMLFTGVCNKGNSTAKNLVSWTSGDRFTGNNTVFYPISKTYQIAGTEFLKRVILNSGYNTIAEGYPGTCPDPILLSETLGKDNVYVLLLKYPSKKVDGIDGLECLRDRCYSRTGKKPKGHGSMGSEGTAISIYNKSSELGLPSWSYPYDCPVTVLGEIFFRDILKVKESYDDFLSWSSNNNFVRSVDCGFEDYNNKVMPLYNIMRSKEATPYDSHILLDNILGDNFEVSLKEDYKQRSIMSSSDYQKVLLEDANVS